MTTTVTITTVDGDSKSVSTITLGDAAQKHVLRSFNPAMKEDDRVGHLVDDTKVLCAALIQQQIDLRSRAYAMQNEATERLDIDRCVARVRAAAKTIELAEALQMQAVKANFVQA